MKKKKKLFKIEFFLSVFALIGLSTYGICSAYDRNKSEAVSREILGAMQVQPERIIVEEQAVVLVLNGHEGDSNRLLDSTEIEKVMVEREIAIPFSISVESNNLLESPSCPFKTSTTCLLYTSRCV